MLIKTIVIHWNPRYLSYGLHNITWVVTSDRYLSTKLIINSWPGLSESHGKCSNLIHTHKPVAWPSLLLRHSHLSIFSNRYPVSCNLISIGILMILSWIYLQICLHAVTMIVLIMYPAKMYPRLSNKSRISRTNKNNIV